jgi:hypothetical protein
LTGARSLLDRMLAGSDGVLRLEPTLVARDFLPPGRRLGLPDDAYDVGERGFLCERWLGSTTKADNRVGPDDEGLSYLCTEDGGRLLLRAAVEADPVAVLGAEYAASHPRGLGRLAKIFDYADRLPYHLHLPQEYADLVGCRAKDEAYYFPDGVDMGPHPESFFGLHPALARDRRADVLLPYLVDWDSDLILKHARGERQVADEGFEIPSGVLHAPGTALTLELQEDSDVLSMFQALNAGRIISKDLLFKDVRPADRQAHGERFPLNFVDWELNGDPFFFENRHTAPQPVARAAQPGGDQWWIFYGNRKFSGKKLVVRPGRTYTAVDGGAYNLLVWRGSGTIGGRAVRGGQPGLDELFVVHGAATGGVPVVNTGTTELVIFTFFGPDVHDTPIPEPYRPT